MVVSDESVTELRELGRVYIHLTLQATGALSDVGAGDGGDGDCGGRSPSASAAPSPSSSTQIASLCEALGIEPLLGRVPSRALSTIAALARREPRIEFKAKPLEPLSPPQSRGMHCTEPLSPYVVTLFLRPAAEQDHSSVEQPDPVVVRQSDYARRVFWHMLRESKPGRPPMSRLAQEPPSMCGFIGCGDACSGDGGGNRDDFRIDKVFSQCPPPSIPPPPGPTGSIGFFNVLPDEALEHISRKLAPRDLANFSASCQTMRRVVMPFVPGLKLRLYRHQACAVWRMLDRERSPRSSLPLPLSCAIPVAQCGMDARSLPLYVDMATGVVYEGHRMPTTQDCCGGLFCDEPGLGKTITALAVILKTLGQQARPPAAYTGPIDQLVDSDGDESPKQMLAGQKISNNKTSNYCSWRPQLRHLLYRPTQLGRYLPFGSEEVDYLSTRGDGTARRIVRAPDYHNPNVGKGSLPAVGLKDVPVFLSGATLVVVPPMLVAHWLTQIEKHVQPSLLRVLTIKRPSEIPSARELAFDYDVVIISFKVLNAVYAVMREQAPVLLCVRFLRIILDEGHKLGASRTGISNFSRVCESLKAERRWIMTGTPTPSTPDTDVRHLQPLLQFVRDESYGLDKDAWMRGIQKAYEAFHPEALCRLDKLLRRVMIRSSKSDVYGLPQCLIKDVILDFSDETADCYNELVCVARRNLVLCDWMSESHDESFLNPKNAKECTEFISNLRSSCNFGGIIRMEFHLEDVSETLDMIYRKGMRSETGILSQVRAEDMYLHLPDIDRWWGHPIYAPTEAALVADDFIGTAAQLALKQRLMGNSWPSKPAAAEVTNGSHDSKEKALRLPRKHASLDSRTHVEFRGIVKDFGERLLRGCNCERCKSYSRIPILSTCGHMVCVECFSSNRFGCTVPECDHKYTLDSKGVPEEVIELQPSVESDTWTPEWDKSESMKMKYLLSRLDEIGERTVWTGASWQKKRPKVIIYSQFTFHNMLLTMTLKYSKYKDAYVELFTNEIERDDIRKSETRDARASRLLRSFVDDEAKHILVMGTANGSVGLDLSFVEYIFLMEPIWDASLEQQVVARAHRLGARATVYVERLAMRGSIEEEILEHGSSSQSGVHVHRRVAETGRKASLLKNLSTVKAGRNYTELPNQAVAQADVIPVGVVVDSEQGKHDVGVNINDANTHSVVDEACDDSTKSTPMIGKVIAPSVAFDQRQRKINNFKKHTRMRNTALDEGTPEASGTTKHRSGAPPDRVMKPQKKRVRFET